MFIFIYEEIKIKVVTIYYLVIGLSFLMIKFLFF